MPTVPVVFVVDDPSVHSSLKFLIGSVGLQVESFDSADRIPVVFITALDDEATRLRALKGGVVDLLRKPVRREAYSEPHTWPCNRRTGDDVCVIAR